MEPETGDNEVMMWNMSRAQLYDFGKRELGVDGPDVLVRWLAFLADQKQNIASDKLTHLQTWETFMLTYGDALLKRIPRKRKTAGGASSFSKRSKKY